jgi:hypothetical protein
MPTHPPPDLRFFADVDVLVAPPLEVGHTLNGLRRLISITGGEARGQGWTARVLPGGVDDQRVVDGTTAYLEARYVLETDAGERIHVHNSAIRHASAAVTAALVRGETVDPSEVYFRCLPRLETAAPSLSWINHRLFAGTGRRLPDRVQLSFFVLD